MCILLPRFPNCADCLQLLRVALGGIEVAMDIWPRQNRPTTSKFVSPRCIAAVLQLYGPRNIDPFLLIACESALRKQGGV